VYGEGVIDPPESNRCWTENIDGRFKPAAGVQEAGREVLMYTGPSGKERNINTSFKVTSWLHILTSLLFLLDVE
jgi:hypothetical protein